MSSDRPRLRPTAPPGVASAESTAIQDPTQQVLAEMLGDPRSAVMRLIQAVCPGDPESEGYQRQLIALRRSVLAVMRRITGTELRTANEYEATFVGRVTVCWQLLYSADQVIKKLRPDDIPARPGLPWLSEAFSPLLGAPVGHSLAAALLDRLRLGAEGEFLRHYCAFFNTIKQIRSKRSAKVPPLLPAKSLREDGVRRIAWWLVRSRRERYVESLSASEPPFLRVHFGHVVAEVYRELAALCGEVLSGVGDARAIVEQEINAWLRYSGLDAGETGSASEPEQSPETIRDLVRAFTEANRLSQKLVIAAEHREAQDDSELEAQLRQYAAENRALEERNRALELELASVARPATLVETPATFTDTSSELRDLVRLIDAKYSLDVLKQIQLGGESPLTLRSFASHVLYSLTKKGLTSYPGEDSFLLSYEKSGLFECDGFEVKPGETVAVTVSQRGWALQAKDRLLPIRRARVVQAHPEGEKR